jgi:serine protease Do
MQSDGDIVVRTLVLTQGDPLLIEEGSGTDGDEHTEE